MIPTELWRFNKVDLAIALHEVDEAVIDRQDPLWIGDLLDLLEARNTPAPLESQGIALPPGVKLLPADPNPGG